MFFHVDIFREHKSQVKKLGISEEEGDTGADEVVSFIDLQQNNLPQFRGKGILKKHGSYGIAMIDSHATE